MKRRTGFVSNSSSSSFIVRGKTVYQVSSYMLEIVIREFSEWGNNETIATKKQIKNQRKKELEDYSTWERNLRKTAKMKDVVDGKIGVTMPSCNYDTYIINKDNLVYISTCNNHPWEFSEFWTGDGADAGDSDAVHNIIQDSFFYNIRNELIHSCRQWHEDIKDRPWCENCKEQPFDYVETKDGEKICGRCYKGSFGKTPEKIIEELRIASKKDMSAFKYLEP